MIWLRYLFFETSKFRIGNVLWMTEASVRTCYYIIGPQCCLLDPYKCENTCHLNMLDELHVWLITNCNHNVLSKIPIHNLKESLKIVKTKFHIYIDFINTTMKYFIISFHFDIYITDEHVFAHSSYILSKTFQLSRRMAKLHVIVRKRVPLSSCSF